jgi:DNA-binding transcriptional regulator PaaX
MEFMMHAGMDGQHEFRVHVLTSDPTLPEKLLTVLSYWGS